MHIYRCNLTHFAEILLLGVHLSMCLTARKKRAHIPQRNMLKHFFHATVMLMVVSKDQPPATQRFLA